MLMTVQGTTPKYSSIEVQHCTALMRHFGLRHPAVDHGAELRHLHQRVRRDAAGESTYFLNRGELGLRRVVVVFHALDAAQISERSSGSIEMPLRFENLLAVADRVESRRPRADRADAQIAEAVYHAADTQRTTPDLWQNSANRELRCAAW